MHLLREDIDTQGGVAICCLGNDVLSKCEKKKFIWGVPERTPHIASFPGSPCARTILQVTESWVRPASMTVFHMCVCSLPATTIYPRWHLPRFSAQGGAWVRG